MSMKNHPPVVAAVDLSSSSSQVLWHAAKLAAAEGLPLVVLHVISGGRLRDWEETLGSRAATAERVEEITLRLKELADEACGGVPAGITVRIGKPYRVILDVVREEGAGLVVLGAHDVSKGRLGAVAAHCARSIPADVLILRDWQSSHFHRIAACVDFSAASAAGLERAIAIAKAHQAALEIIHVMYPPSRDPWGRVIEEGMAGGEGAGYDALVRERVAARLEAFLQSYRERLVGVDSRVTILEGENPSTAIAAHVQAGEVDLTVVGSHGASWVEEFVLGSNAERLTHDSSSSVLIARGRVG